MLKKLMVGTFICLLLGNYGLVAHANPTTSMGTRVLAQTTVEDIKSQEEERINLITPSKNMVVTDTNMMVKFEAPEGTQVTIDVYYDSSVMNKTRRYVQAYQPIEIEVGALRKGWAELELKKSLNKIKFTAVYKNGISDIINRIIEVKDISELEEEVTKNISRTPSSKVLNSIVNKDSK